MTAAGRIAYLNDPYVQSIVAAAEERIEFLTGKKIKLEAQLAPQAEQEKSEKVPPTTESLQTLYNICVSWGITEQQLRTKRKTVEFFIRRRIACSIIRKQHKNLTLQTVADMVGLADHTTVVHNMELFKLGLAGKHKHQSVFDHLFQTVKTIYYNEA